MQYLHKVFSAHPAPASDAGDAAHALVAAAAECSHVCTACADACISSEDPSQLRQCIRTTLDCADICTTTARLISRPGEQERSVLRAQLEACAQATRACAKECSAHAETMEHCRVCADACNAAAKACDDMITALV